MTHRADHHGRPCLPELIGEVLGGLSIIIAAGGAIWALHLVGL